MTLLAKETVTGAAPTEGFEAVPPFRLRESMNGMGVAPGKVWFFELAEAVIDADRCIRCGACIAACPSDSLGVNKDNDLPYLVKMCTGCALCWDFCPRGGLRYEATWPAEPELQLSAPGEPGAAPVRTSARPDDPAAEVAGDDDWRIVGGDPQGLGVLRSSVAARVRADSKYTVSGAQDGGVVTAVLVAALESGAIDGALVAREDPLTPWRGVPYFATTREQLVATGGSFYNQTLALAGLDLSKTGLGADARIAIVGTPCEVQGIRALQARSWRRGVSRVDAVTLSIALLCTKSFDYKRLMLGLLRDERGLDLAEVGKVDVIHGRMFVFDRAGAVLVDEPVKAFHSAALKGCDECADFAGRGADLSVGSVGSDDGWSSVLVRTEEGSAALDRVLSELDVMAIERPEALEKLDQLDRRIALRSLPRPFDPEGPMFIDFADHVAAYAPTDRAPVRQGW
jgi:coenzyme F420 hydrogenase subunit beta